MKSRLKDIFSIARFRSGETIRRQNGRNHCLIVPAVVTELLKIIFISVKKDMECAILAF